MRRNSPLASQWYVGRVTNDRGRCEAGERLRTRHPTSRMPLETRGRRGGDGSRERRVTIAPAQEKTLPREVGTEGHGVLSAKVDHVDRAKTEGFREC